MTIKITINYLVNKNFRKSYKIGEIIEKVCKQNFCIKINMG